MYTIRFTFCRINAYEEEQNIVIDMICYESPDMLYLMSLQNLATAQSDPDYAKSFVGRPYRFVLPLAVRPLRGHSKLTGENLVTLSYSLGATAHLISKNTIHIKPGRICSVSCETPTINYDSYNGKAYRYFYGMCSDIDHPESAGKIYKVGLL